MSEIEKENLKEKAKKDLTKKYAIKLKELALKGYKKIKNISIKIFNKVKPSALKVYRKLKKIAKEVYKQIQHAIKQKKQHVRPLILELPLYILKDMALGFYKGAKQGYVLYKIRRDMKDREVK